MPLQTNLTGSTPQGTPTSPTHSVMHNLLHAYRNAFHVIDGIEYAQTRAGVQAAVDATSSAGGGVVLIPSDVTITFDTTTVTVPSNVSIEGCGRTSVIKAPSGSSGVYLFTTSGNDGTATTLNANQAEGDLTIVLTSGGVAAAGLAVGDYIYIYDSSTGYNLATRITVIATQTLTLSEPLPNAFLSATSSIAKFSPLISNVAFRNFTIDGNTNSGATRGIFLNYTVNVEIENLFCKDIPEASIYAIECYNIHIKNLELVECGSANESDIHLTYSTNIHIDGLRSMRASGFGPQIAFSCYGILANLYSTMANGRGYKIQNTHYFNHTNIQVLKSANTYTGISVTQKSHRNIFNGVIAMGNGAAGIWVEGTSDNFNRFIGGISKFNTTRDVEIGSGATSNVFLYVEYTNILDSGTTTVKVP